MPTVQSLSGVEPVTVEEAKLAARIDTDALDDDIEENITAAREQAEHITGRCYRPQVLREELTDWPAANEAIAVHQATACKVYTWSGSDFVELSSAAYVFAPGGIGNNGTVLAPVAGASWPTLPDRPVGPRVRIDLTAGPATPDSVPSQVKRYIKASVAAWLKNPEATSAVAVAPSELFQRLLDRERLWS